MNQVQTYYTHSGNTTLRGMALVNVAGLVSALILGAIYGYTLRYIPYIYLNVILTLGLGASLGWWIGHVGKWGHIRNTLVLFYFGLLFGLAAVYTSWVSWIYAATNQHAFIVDPRLIWKLLKAIAVNGTWSLSGVPVNGVPLYLIWAFEALIIIGLSTLIAGTTIADEVYCESCNKWIKTNHPVYPLEPIADPDLFKYELENGNHTTLGAMKKISLKSKQYTRFDLTQCPGCQLLHLLSVSTITKYTGRKGDEKEITVNIIKKFIINPDTYHMLLGLDQSLDKPSATP